MSVSYDRGMNTLYAIVEWRKLRKPRSWIARELDLTLRDVTDVLRVYGDTKRDHISLEKYDRMRDMVLEDCSQNEIMRTLNTDARTIRRWFPYVGWSRGGDGAAMMKKAREVL